jgi:hypothetical protein
MRTKTLLLAAAAALAAGILSSSAQVYSANVVGYVSVTLTNGLNLVCNPLDLDGTGTNNTIYTCVGTNLPNLTKVLTFNGSAYPSSTLNANSGVWNNTAGTQYAMQPGNGFFISIPPSASYPQTVTFVGTVLQGPVANTLTPGLIQLVGSQVPFAGDLVTNLNYQPANLDKVLPWNTALQTYGSTHTYNGTSQLWNGGGTPQISVAQGFFLTPHATSVWTNDFIVQ